MSQTLGNSPSLKYNNGKLVLLVNKSPIPSCQFVPPFKYIVVLKNVIFSLDKKYQSYLIANTLNIDLNIISAWPFLTRQSTWTVKLDAYGTYILSYLYIKFPNWNNWTPKNPLSLEGIYLLNKLELKSFLDRLSGNSLSINKRQNVFLEVAKYLANNKYLNQEETDAVNDESFSICLTKRVDDLKRELEKHGKPIKELTGRTLISLTIELARINHYIREHGISLDKLLLMTNQERYLLAQKYGLVKNTDISSRSASNDRYNFSQLVRYLIQHHHLDPIYHFIETKSFCFFFQQLIRNNSLCLANLFDIYLAGRLIDDKPIKEKELSKCEAIALLYYFGILETDLEEGKLTYLSIKYIDSDFRRLNIPGVDNIAYPRGIITYERLINIINQKEADYYLKSTELLFCDIYTESFLTSPIGEISFPSKRKTDINFNLFDELKNHPSTQPHFYTTWERPTGECPYNYLSRFHLENVMDEREIMVNCSTEAIRQMLTAIDKVDGMQWILEAPSTLSYYNAGIRKLNLLNNNYKVKLIDIAMHLKDYGIAGDSISVPQPNKIKYYHSSDNIKIILQAAIQGGWPNIPISRITDGTWSTNDQLQKELDLLVKYPPIIELEFYLKLRRRQWTDLISLVEILYMDPSDLVINEKFELLFLLSRGYLYPHPDFNLRKERYSKLTTLRPEIKELIPKIWNVPGSRPFWLKLAFHLPMILNPIDDFIIDRLAELLGVVQPVGTQLSEYLNGHISQYLSIFHEKVGAIPLNRFRPAGLHQCNLKRTTDREIIESLGIIPYYTSRETLISSIRTLWYKPSFFRSIKRESINKQTTYLTDVTDINEIMIGYGILSKYYCYEIEELCGAFYMGDDKYFHFRHPENTGEEFSRDEINELLCLLDDIFLLSVNESKAILDLKERIRLGLEHLAKREYITKETYLTIANLPKDRRDIMKDWFIKVFEAGMYMRQWTGPPEGYPFNKDDTEKGLNPAEDKNSLLAPALCEVDKIWSTLSPDEQELLTQLPSLYYVPGNHRAENGSYSRDSRNIVKRYKLAATGKVCIRLSSSKLVISTDFYLKILFDYRIASFYPHLVANIF